MQQATVNLFADMGVQPGHAAGRSRRGDRRPPTRTAPTSTITSPAAGAVVDRARHDDRRHGERCRRWRGRRRRGVGRQRRDLAPGHRPRGAGAYDVDAARRPAGHDPRSRAVDDSGNLGAVGRRSRWTSRRVESAPARSSRTTSPAWPQNDDTQPIELGVQFRSDDERVRSPALRFYNAAPGNTGTHVGHLWTRRRQAARRGPTSPATSGSGWQRRSCCQRRSR